MLWYSIECTFVMVATIECTCIHGLKSVSVIIKQRVILIHYNCMRGPGGGQGVQTPPPPLEKIQKIGLHSNTGPEPLKITKLPGHNSMLGHHPHISETQFKWCFAGGSMTARFYWHFLDSPYPH